MSKYNHLDPCEEFLANEKAEFLEKGIWRSKIQIIDRLLSDPLNMRPVYEEIRSKLDSRHKWIRVLELAIDAALFHNPDASFKLRNEIKRVIEINS